MCLQPPVIFFFLPVFPLRFNASVLKKLQTASLLPRRNIVMKEHLTLTSEALASRLAFLSLYFLTGEREIVVTVSKGCCEYEVTCRSTRENAWKITLQMGSTVIIKDYLNLLIS